MNLLLKIPLLLLLLAAASSPCHALMFIEDVSKDRAKELGVGIRSDVAGPNEVRVRLEFTVKGGLTNFSHVELEIAEGERRLVSARLLADRPAPGCVAVNFTVDQVNVTRSVLTIVVRHGPRSTVGYRFKVKDFIEHKARR
jgi:hypothetical protein